MSISSARDQDQFAALYREHYQEILSFALRRVAPDDAQEIASDTFLVAWRKYAERPDRPLLWLYRIASFEIANHARQGMRRKALLSRLGLERPYETNEAFLDRDASSSAVRAAFDSLREADQEVLRLAAWEELTAEEAATVLNCTSVAYRVRLHRARARLERAAAHIAPGQARKVDAPPSPSRHGQPDSVPPKTSARKDVS